MNECEQILQSLCNHASEIRRFGVKTCSVFGSASRGDLGPESDIDLLVEFSDPTFDNFMELAFFLEDLLSRKVELVCSESLRPEFKNKIEPDLKRIA